MKIFVSVISQIALLFSFIITGFILKKLNIIPKESSKVLSKLESFIFMPCVIINTFWKNCTIKNISEKWIYLVYSTVILVICVILSFIISKFLSKDEYLRKIYRYSLAVSNFGFVGTAMVSGIYGSESIELFDYLIFTLPLNAFTYSLGISWLVPNNNSHFSLKSFINPIFISLFIGAILGILSIKRFRIITSFITSSADCMSPVAMILTGFVIGSYALNTLFTQWQTYVVALLRLIIFPLLFVFGLKAINSPQEIIVATLSAHSMPLGLNTVIIPSAYDKDPKTGASLALVSQLCAIISVPLIFLFFS